MADVDPRIVQFDALSKEVLAATQRARTTVTQTEKKAVQADEAVGRLEARAQGRGAGNLTDETSAGETAAESSVKRRTVYNDEAKALENLNKVRSKAITQLEAESITQAQAFKNVKQYGPYAGGRRNYNAGGYGAGGPGIPSIPPGGTVPPPGGFLALPQKTSGVNDRGFVGPNPTKVEEDPATVQEAARYREAASSADRYSTSISKLAVEQNLASQGMRKNGALTTEFIAAANRGEVTVRELGYQTAATIGKFGGWLAAGSAVYGVFAAVQKLGSGALDAYSGVNELQRVINNVEPVGAKAEFSKLAGEFNVPIQTVTESVYQMGKVFHSQDAAIAASRAVLYSYKVGELDVADSSRYLIAILNGFHLPASKVAQVFDQINEAQNEFGITINDVEAGLAKASGTFHAAGGSYSNLLALITTAQKATGNTGSTIGTALARAPNFLRKPANEAVLKEFGIKPGQAIDATIEAAFKVSQKLSGKKLQELAAAIFGPQYGARIGTPLLQQEELFNKVKRQTSPQASKGSAQRELSTQLGSVEEQIGKIGISLERLGAQLADSHALDVFGLLLKLLNVTLGEAVTLAEAFDKLPDGVKRTLTYVGELAIVLRALRRLNLGESLEAGGAKGGVRGAAASVFSSGPIGEARKYRQSLLDEKGQLESRVASGTQQHTEAARTAEATKGLLVQENERAALLFKQKDGNDALSASYEDAVLNAKRYEAQLESLSIAQTDLAARLVADRNRLSEVESSAEQTTSGKFGTLNTKAALEDRERNRGRNFYATTFERPAESEPVTGPGLTEEQAKAAGASARASADGLTRAEKSLQLSAAESSFQKAAAQGEAQEVQVSRIGQAAGRFSGAFNSVINKLGTIAFVAGIGFTVYSLVESAVSSLEDELSSLEKLSAEQIKSVAQKQAHGHGSASTTFSDFLTGSGAFHGPIEELLGYGSSQGEGGQLQEIEEQKIEYAKQIIRLQGKQKSKGEPVFYRSGKEIRERIERIAKQNVTSAAKLKELEDAEVEVEHSFNAENGKQTGKEAKAIEQAIEIAKGVLGNAKDFAHAVSLMTSKQLGETATDYNALTTTTSGRFDNFAATRAAVVFRRQAKTLGSTSGPQAAKELADAQKEYYESLSSGIEGELTLNLEQSRSPEQRVNALAKALHQAATRYGSNGKALANARQSQHKAEEELAGAEDVSGVLEGLGFTGKGQGKANVSAAKANLEKQKARIRVLSKESKLQNELLQKLEENLEKAAYEYSTAISDSKFSYRESLTQDPLKQAQLQIKQVNADLPGAIKIFGHESSQVYSLLEQREQAVNNIVQAELQGIGARDTLRASGINPNNAIAKSQAALQKLRDEAGFEKAHSNSFSPTQITELQAQIREAELQLANDIAQEATELKDAAFARKIAQLESADHPVQAAQQKINELKYNISRAKTPVEKANLEAQLPTAYKTKREEVGKAKLDTIEFDASIDKITTSQEIAALDHLLHDYKLSLATRRSIREQLHSLKSSEGFELDVGNISIPTVYDIRRAIQGGVQNRPGVQVTNAPRITVNNYSSDDKVVGRALGHVLGNSTAGAARSAGVGG